MNLIDFQEIVCLQGDEPVTDSRKVAQHFGKRHANVLRDIERLQCSEKFKAANFEFSFEINDLANGKPDKVCRMTKDGFLFLVMGYTGAKAAAIKESFIEAFNAMAAWIRAQEIKTELLQVEGLLDREEAEASIHGRGLALSRYTRPPLRQRIARLQGKLQLRLQFA